MSFMRYKSCGGKVQRYLRRILRLDTENKRDFTNSSTLIYLIETEVKCITIIFKAGLFNRAALKLSIRFVELHVRREF